MSAAPLRTAAAAAPAQAPVPASPAKSGTLANAEARTPLPSQPPADRLALAEKPKKPVAPAEAATHKPSAATGDSYTVMSGDSLNKISKKTGVTVAELKTANGLGEGGLQIGQKLALSKSAAAKSATAKPAPAVAAAKPATVVAVPKPAPALDPVATGSAKVEAQPVAYTPPQPAKQVLAEAESAPAAEAPDATGVGKMRWPVRGRVVAKYGAKGSQASDGLDIAVPEGTPVKAAENGVVIYAGNGLKEFGNTVLVRHESGLVTVYGHASQLKVTRGEKVTRGQEIALSGMSGTTDTPKLHFEVRKNSAPVDPSGFLQ